MLGAVPHEIFRVSFYSGPLRNTVLYFFFIMVNSFFIFYFFYISKKICQAGFTIWVEVLWAELRSCLQYATSSSTAPLGVPQLGLEHVHGGT